VDLIALPFTRQNRVSLDKATMASRAEDKRSNGSRHLLEATADDADAPVKIYIYQVVRYQGDNYIRPVGPVRAEMKDRVLPHLSRLTATLPPRRSTTAAFPG